MKHEIYKTTILIACIAIFYSCAAPQKTQQARIKGNSSKNYKNNKRTKIADSLENILLNCCESVGCGLDVYCSKPNCGDVIVNCHRIDEDLFKTLTNDMSDGHATFSPKK